MNRFIAIGEIVKAVGLKGELKLYPLLDFFEPLLDTAFLVWADGQPATVHGHRQAGSCLAVRTREANSRDGAEALVGRTLGFMSDSYLSETFPRPTGGLPFRWLGRNVVLTDGSPVGEVDEVRLGGGQLILVIDSEKGQILVPAVAPILQVEDGLEGDLVIDPPEGLLDVQFG